MEDEPCWNCTTMGNQTCGTVETDEPPVPPVVDATTAPFVDLIGDDPCIPWRVDPTKGTGAKYGLPCTPPAIGEAASGQLANTGHSLSLLIVAIVLIAVGGLCVHIARDGEEA